MQKAIWTEGFTMSLEAVVNKESKFLQLRILSAFDRCKTITHNENVLKICKGNGNELSNLWFLEIVLMLIINRINFVLICFTWICFVAYTDCLYNVELYAT